MMQEHFDTPEALDEKLQKLEELVRASKHMVVFTGAGISTSAGISDFRGPTGVWTRKAQGLAPIAGTSTVKALPTKTHMGIVELHRRGILQYVISQNCDGLHRRSGLPGSAISELHGNSNIEICESCGRRFFRDFKATRQVRTFDHFTGRFCHCKGRLLESTIDFGQNLPSRPLRLAEEESEKADLHIVFGSSLTVSPACDMPRTTAAHGGKLIIVNLQKTPLTRKAAFQIHAHTDTVMEMLMKRLQIPIPNFLLERRVVFGLDGNEVFAKSVDVHMPDQEASVICTVDWDGTTQEITESHRKQANLDISRLRPTLHFVGHYQEPPLTLDICLCDGSKDVLLAFDPLSGKWEVTTVTTTPADGGVWTAVAKLFSSPEEVCDVDIEYGLPPPICHK
jgi:mono-ADP-ribosyltransferase sirtuin 6